MWFCRSSPCYYKGKTQGIMVFCIEKKSVFKMTKNNILDVSWSWMIYEHVFEFENAWKSMKQEVYKNRYFCENLAFICLIHSSFMVLDVSRYCYWCFLFSFNSCDGICSINIFEAPLYMQYCSSMFIGWTICNLKNQSLDRAYKLLLVKNT